MKIFISYGHKDFPLFINQFIDDFSKEHVVWTDKGLQLGQNWAADIDEHIDSCDVFLLLMARSSVRKDGYCFGEIARAKELKKPVIVVKLDEVTMPSLLAQDQYFSMESCIDIDDSINLEEYKRKLSELMNKINIQFQKKQNNEIRLLYYFDNEAHVEQLLKTFVGRKWVASYFDEFCNDEKRVMLINGEAGSGKSCILAYLYKENKAKASIHFCNNQDTKSYDIQLIIQSIVCDLGRCYEEYQTYMSAVINHENNFADMSPYDLFDLLLLDPLKKVQLSGEFYIIIDALDEISVKCRKAFFQIINRFLELPSNFKFIYTTRNENAIVNAIMKQYPFCLEDINKKNEGDIQLYITKTLDLAKIHYDMTSVDKIVHQSGGDFLYVKFILDELKIRKTFDVTKVEFPIGMKGVCQNYFDRLFDEENEEYEKEIKPFLEILCACKEPISIGYIEDILCNPDFDLHSIVKRMSMFLICKEDRISISHKSLYDWLYSMDYDDPYYISIKNGSKAIYKWAKKLMANGKVNEYIYQYGFYHFVELEKIEDIIEILGLSNERILDSFILFVNKLVREKSDKRLYEIFDAIIVSDVDYIRIVLRCIKNLVQFGKRDYAKGLLKTFESDSKYGMLCNFLEFIEEKSTNKSILELIEKGEILIKEVQIDDRTKADLARTLGDAYRESGQHEKAMKLYNSAKELCGRDRQCDTYFDSECALIDMAYVYGNVPEAKEMLELMEKRIDMATDNITRYKYNRLQGNLCSSLQEADSSLEYFEQSLEIVQHMGFPLKVIEAKNSIAEVSREQTSAFELLKEARDLCNMLDMNSLEYGKSYYIEAGIYLEKGEYATAINKAEHSYQILSKVGYGSGMARAKFIKGMALYKQMQYEEAITYYEYTLAYYIRENIYPAFRVESFYYLLKCAEYIGKISDYIKCDNLMKVGNKQYFNYLNEMILYIEEITKDET